MLNPAIETSVANSNAPVMISSASREPRGRRLALTPRVGDEVDFVAAPVLAIFPPSIRLRIPMIHAGPRNNGMSYRKPRTPRRGMGDVHL